MKSIYVVSIVAVMAVSAAFAVSTIPTADRVGLATLEYVDATVQEKIAPGTTGSVVVYDGVDSQTDQPQFSEVAIFDGANSYDETTDYNKFITAGPIADVATAAETLTIPDTELVCANSPECSLWTRPAASAMVPVFTTGTFAPLTAVAAPQCMADGATGCTSDSDCCNYCDDSGKIPTCASCKQGNASCTLGAECCSKTCEKKGTCAEAASECAKSGESCLKLECCKGLTCGKNGICG
ncbi:MAG: hypothetical protein J6T27_01975 [Alphaproteobacteria bacterium]|nr:hypothetical protein [Alphaproteobacteria bacterium]